ncbi:MAG: cobyrinate a,c-diamide synthase [Pyrobaculum sp.]
MTPRLVISSFRGMSGKTIITLGILYGLYKRGLRVAPFKAGPDYIDPSYHQTAARRPGRNLDVVLMGEDGVVKRFVKYSKDADVAIVEGVLGLYDSLDGVSELGSTAQLAKLLKAPVVLVLNGDRTNRTLRAIVRGMKLFDPKVEIPAVILTNVTERQKEKLVKSLPEEGVEVLGAVPKSKALEEAFRYRHLGLTPTGERGDVDTVIHVLENYVTPHIDLDRLVEIAKAAGEIETSPDPEATGGGSCRVGIVMDNAFTFYYPELIEEAASLGRPVFISALRDNTLPDIDVAIIGGGFPEIFAERLEKNKPFKKSLLSYIERGGVLYAECGGLMYLTSSIVINRSEYEMVGAIDAVTILLDKPVGKGYVWGVVTGDTPIAPKGTTIKGHEFHYSKIVMREKAPLAIRLERGVGVGGGLDGIVKKNMHAQYTHIHPYTYSVLRKLCRYT